MVLIGTTDQESKERIEFLTAVTVQCTTNGPDHGEHEQTLKPISYLEKKRIEKSV
jgi:hypothetical protein